MSLSVARQASFLPKFGKESLVGCGLVRFREHLCGFALPLSVGVRSDVRFYAH